MPFQSQFTVHNPYRFKSQFSYINWLLLLVCRSEQRTDALKHFIGAKAGAYYLVKYCLCSIDIGRFSLEVSSRSGAFGTDTRQWLSYLMRDCRNCRLQVRQFVFTLTPQHLVRAYETCIHPNKFEEHRGQYYCRNDDRECPDSVGSHTVPADDKQTRYCLFNHGRKDRDGQPQIEYGASDESKAL